MSSKYLIYIDEITPELVEEGALQRRIDLLIANNRLAIERLRQEYEAAQREVGKIQLRCEARAKSLRSSGMPAKEIAEWFGVPIAAIHRWLRAPIVAELTIKESP